MAEKESFLEKLEGIGREYEVKLSTEDWVQSRLRWEDWGSLLPELVAFAEQEIRRRKWRGHRSGVLPEGYDGNGVAAQVIMETLQGQAKLAPGWTRERLKQELERRVSNEVRRLHKLQEAGSTRSEWEVVSPHANGEPRSVLEQMRARSSGGSDEKELQEQERVRKEAELRIAEKLHGEDEAMERLFNCLREGVVKRRQIAKKLGVSPGAVTNCRKRLNRKLDELGESEPGCPQWVIEEWKAK